MSVCVFTGYFFTSVEELRAVFMFLKAFNKFSTQTLNPVKGAVCKWTEFALLNHSH